ncbi:uncharacterized protein LOC142906444 [Petromyzon marinus]|uniref:uncharacterized protein LOC142906444 n=1 Tax=Petromyzon marinus TaxID=7757 RepID=UPI003F6EE64E
MRRGGGGAERELQLLSLLERVTASLSSPTMALLVSFAEAVAEHLVRLLSHVSKMAKPPSLSALLRVEKQLAEHFDSCDLPSLGLGSLDILHRNAQVDLEPQREASAQSATSCMEFIHQCGSLDTAALTAVDCAVGQHYGVHSCRNLGHGPVANLVKLAQKAKPGGSSGGAHRCAVLYEETALCARDSRFGSPLQSALLLTPLLTS